jgi:hypothetical protein
MQYNYVYYCDTCNFIRPPFTALSAPTHTAGQSHRIAPAAPATDAVPAAAAAAAATTTGEAAAAASAEGIYAAEASC